MNRHPLRSFALRCFAAALICAVMLPALWAQSLNSTLSGTVTDSSGAPLPGAKILLTFTTTGTVSATTSDASGHYVLPNLQTGDYQLQAFVKGFKIYVQKGIFLAPNTTAQIDVKLQLGTQEQTVEVNANANPLNLENAQRSDSITPQVLKSLPLMASGSIRSSAAFAVLMPGVTTGSGSNPYDARIDGGLPNGGEAILDGVSMEEGTMNQTGMVSIYQDFALSPDMVSQLQVLTSNYGPEYGSSSSGQIILVTKSGTNQFHGGLFEYNRNTALNASPWGSMGKRPKDIENDFGGFVGGPAKLPWLNSGRRKTFFYFNYEAFRIAGGTSRPTISIPSLAERKGDFRDWVDAKGNLIPIYDPATIHPNPAFDPTKDVDAKTGNIPYIGQQFMGCDGKTPNVICPTDPRLQNSLAQAWFKFLPDPTNNGALNNYLAPKPVPDALLAHTNDYTGKIDEYLGDRDHWAYSFYIQRTSPNKQSLLAPQLANGSFADPENAIIERLNWDHTFSPTVLNHAAFGYLNRNEGYGSIDEQYASEFPKIPGVASYDYPPVISFGDNFYGYGDSSGVNTQNVTSRPSYIANDVVSWVVGHHVIKFGGEIRFLGQNINSNNNESGNFYFDRSTTGLPGVVSGSPIASFLLGTVASGSVTYSAIHTVYPRQRAYALFAGDTWTVNSKLSLNYGLRWDVFTPTIEKYNDFSFFDPEGANPGAGGRPGRLAFAGPGWGAASYGALYPEQLFKKGFAPRLGLAYSLNADTVIHAGYGIYFDQAFYPGWGGGISQEGFSANETFNASNGGVTPAFLLSQGIPQNFKMPPYIDSSYANGQGAPLYRPKGANFRPYGQQWNLSVEHSFTNNFYVTAAYVANKGTHLPSQIQPLNALDPALLSMGQKLNDQFQPGQTTLDGVSIPYAGWVEQMTGCAPSVAQALLPYPQYCGNIYGENESVGNSTYHSLQLKAEKRYSNGLSVIGSYSWSKILTDSDATQSQSTTWSGGEGVISPFQSRRNKGLALEDVPSALSVATVYDLPFGRGKHWLNTGGIVNTILGGWSMSSVIHASSGIPLFFRSSNCNVPSQFAAGCIPSILPGANPFLQSEGDYHPNAMDPSTSKPLLNVAAFTPADSFNFNFGNGPRVSNLRGFGYHNQDLALFKDFSITEHLKLQVGAEAFNVWNLHILNGGGSDLGIDTDVASPTFGQWNGNVSPPRNIQIAARLTF